MMKRQCKPQYAVLVRVLLTTPLEATVLVSKDIVEFELRILQVAFNVGKTCLEDRAFDTDVLSGCVECRHGD